MFWYLKALKQYTDFKGRAQRAEFWSFIILNLIISSLILELDTFLGTYYMDYSDPLLSNLEDKRVGLFNGIFSLIIFIPTVAVWVRRLHDVGKSGLWFFAVFIPIIGWLILLLFSLKDSVEDNQYGKNPKTEKDHTEEIIDEMEKIIE